MLDAQKNRQCCFDSSEVKWVWACWVFGGEPSRGHQICSIGWEVKASSRRKKEHATSIVLPREVHKRSHEVTRSWAWFFSTKALWLKRTLNMCDPGQNWSVMFPTEPFVCSWGKKSVTGCNIFYSLKNMDSLKWPLESILVVSFGGRFSLPAQQVFSVLQKLLW